MVRKIGKSALVVLSVFLLAGCGNAGGAATRIETQNAVDRALMEGVESANNGAVGTSEKAQGQNTKTGSGEQNAENDLKTGGEREGADSSGQAKESGAEYRGNNVLENGTDDGTVYDEVDIDLTEMSGDMVYATVYQIMVAPEVYEGKTVKMKGSYYVAYDAVTDTYYHMTFIADAAACCAQGIEFIWGDGSHDLDDYPDYYAEIEVTGVFTTYTEEGDPNVYCTLKDATMKLASF